MWRWSNCRTVLSLANFMKKFSYSLVVLGAMASLNVHAAPAGTAGSAAASRPAIKASDLFTNSIVAKGKGVTVTRAQLDEAVVGLRTSAASQGRPIPPALEKRFESEVLENLIRVQLLNNRANDADKAKAKADVEKRISDIKSRAGTAELFQKQLQSVGLTEDELKAKMLEELTAEAVLRRELNVEIKPEDVKKYFEDNPGEFEVPETVRAAHVLISTKDPTDTNNPPALQRDLSEVQKKEKLKLAEDVLKKARAGEDFAKLAKEYSDDPGSKDKGGEYTFARGQMVKPFEDAAFSMNTNQVSDIVTTQYGYHIIKLFEKSPAHTLDFDKVKDDIKEALTARELRSKVPDYVEGIEKAADVEILDESLKPQESAIIPPAVPDATTGNR